MKKLILILLILILVLTTGCWDMREINERLFPYSIGVDLNEEEGKDKYIVTISYLNINAIGKNATQEEMVFVVNTPASSIFEAIKELAIETPYPIGLKHLRVLVLGQDLAKESEMVKEIMDGLSRDFIVNKKIQIVVAEGKAKDILETVPKASKQEEIEGAIYSMLRRGRTSCRYTPKTLTGFIKDMDRQGGTTVPRIEAKDDTIKVFGAAVIKDYEIIGKLDEIENRSIAFMTHEVGTELVDVNYGDGMISYEMTNHSAKKKLIKDEGNLKMRINIEAEGTLQGYTILDRKEMDGEEVLNNMERAISKHLEGEIRHVLNKIQNEYQVDIINVGENIHKFHPKIWKEISDDWNETFSEMEIEINVDAKLRRRGLTE